MLPTPIQQFLGALHRHGALPRHRAGPRQSFRHDRFLPALVRHPAHEAGPARFLGAKHPSAQADILHPAARAHDLDQPAQRARVGRDPDIDLLDREPGLGRADPNVAAHRDVDAQPERVAVQGGDHRLLAPLHRRDAVLDVEDEPTHLGCDARAIFATVRGRRRRRRRGSEDAGLEGGNHVEAGGECVGTGAGEHDGPGGRVPREVSEYVAQLGPHAEEVNVACGESR